MVALFFIIMALHIEAPIPTLPPPPQVAVEKPSLIIYANPRFAFTKLLTTGEPAVITFIAFLRGGRDDDPDFYCLGIDWDWDDGILEDRVDSPHSTWAGTCPQYEPGKSTMRRLWLNRYQYWYPGSYKIHVRLFKRDIVAFREVQVTILGQ